MTNNIPQNTVELANKYGEKIDSALQQLSAKLGLGIDHFWPVLVEQQRLEGLIDIFTWLTLAFLTYSLFRASKKTPGELFGGPNPTKKDFYYILGSVFCIFLGLSFLLGAARSFSKTFNPQYHALVDIAQTIK